MAHEGLFHLLSSSLIPPLCRKDTQTPQHRIGYCRKNDKKADCRTNNIKEICFPSKHQAKHDTEYTGTDNTDNKVLLRRAVGL